MISSQNSSRENGLPGKLDFSSSRCVQWNHFCFLTAIKKLSILAFTMENYQTQGLVMNGTRINLIETKICLRQN